MKFDSYFKKLTKVCSEKGLSMKPLGLTGRKVIWLLRNDVSGPGLLICGGVHGDEIAGPLGILKFLEQCNYSDLYSVNLNFIPVVSPIAFMKRRYSYGQTNCGFVPTFKDKLSVEGKVLMKNYSLLKQCAENGFLSLHETLDEKGFFLYFYGETSEYQDALDERDEGKKFFHIVPSGTKTYEPNCPDGYIRQGIVHNMFDGSFEHRLSIDGVPICIVTETPGKESIENRITATVALISNFIRLRGGQNER